MSPTASQVKLVFFENEFLGEILKEVYMTKTSKGVFTHTEEGNLNGRFYNYKITVGGVENEATDLYAKAVSVNGIRSMVVDLEQTNPKGWENDKRPVINSFTDAIIYKYIYVTYQLMKVPT